MMHFHGRSWPKFLQYDGDATKWTEIEYFEYWDFARQFLCEKNGKRYLFVAPFLALDDEYSDFFIIREVPLECKREDLRQKSYFFLEIGQILPVSEVTMDETRKSYILSVCLDRLQSDEQDDGGQSVTGVFKRR